MGLDRNVMMIVAQNGFRDEEFDIPYRIFNANDLSVNIASKERDLCIGKNGLKCYADIKIADIYVEYFDIFVLVGGLGCLDYENYTLLHEILKKAYKLNKIIGSICISPRILMKAGLLKGKRFTMWNEDHSQDIYIKESGGIYTGNDVEVDGNIVTANGPKAAEKFTKTIIAKLNKYSF